tara:strand:+ start:1215 stop:1418 length:204 start_codon:yes stop_codon:yes gene_type:complete
MENKNIKIILYISLWVIIWGTVASLIDYPLLKQGVYSEGAIGQYLTFSLTAVISIIGARKFSKKFDL